MVDTAKSATGQQVVVAAAMMVVVVVVAAMMVVGCGIVMIRTILVMV